MAFLGGMGALLLALASPLDAFADLLLQLHMVQHWLLMMVAPPLIFAALAAMFYVGMSRENPDELPTALAGKAAPAVVVSAPAGLVLAANGTFCAHTGYAEDQLVGKPLRELQHPKVHAVQDVRFAVPGVQVPDFEQVRHGPYPMCPYRLPSPPDPSTPARTALRRESRRG